ncbi:MAG TPA: membrane protein insertion efficiency factor YidD [Dehalococcoidia bacterium]|nr:membrane protein insertion efficiency factor YidD [Dehalococcoidia bacterium]
MRHLAVKLIHGYQRAVSPLLRNNCKYEPSCSEYSAQAIEHFGVIRGVPMTAWRIARCNPFSKGGFDPPFRANSQARPAAQSSRDTSVPRADV